MIAAINYTVKRYGSLYNGWTARGYKGYENGGIPKSGEIYVANEHGLVLSTLETSEISMW